MSAGPQAFTNRPSWMKYILATECSNPAATKAETGNKAAATVSLVLRAPSNSHTARQTSTVAQGGEKQRLIEGQGSLVGRDRQHDGGDCPCPARYWPASSAVPIAPMKLPI